MVSESDTRRCAIEEVVPQRGVDTRRCASKDAGPQGGWICGVPGRWALKGGGL